MILLATNIDSTSLFHDLSPGANTAAANILALLMAAKLIGDNLDDATLDSLPKSILFAFFQNENYGYVGSRRLLKDLSYPGFQCGGDGDGAENNNNANDQTLIVPSVAKDAQKRLDDGERVSHGCLYPLRPNLDFMSLGEIEGMIAVDQIGLLTNNAFYVHSAQGNDDNDISQLLTQFLLGLSDDNYSISESSADQNDDNNNNNGSPLPPTPLSSLLNLSNGDKGGAILAGYDASYQENSAYLSHLDVDSDSRSLDLNAIASAATILARAALATAYYDNDNGNGDMDEALEYALSMIPTLSFDNDNDETGNNADNGTIFQSLAHCLLHDGNCDTLISHANAARYQLQKSNGGTDLGLGTSLGNPPNYYPSIFDKNNGQPFVQVNGRWYGAYLGAGKQQDQENNSEDDKDDDAPKDTYGEESSDDTFLHRPSLLEMAISSLLDDFLGRGSIDQPHQSCKKPNDCKDVTYCASPGDEAICGGSNVCVCSRSRFHLALDEALEAIPDKATGMFQYTNDDEGISAVYTEPYWSASIGVSVYRMASSATGYWTLLAASCVASFWIFLALTIRRKLVKEKLY